ncbi:hypothetical protein J4E81_005654 [Alternaria sp. BMP 2799]|nr:hypothetical protein J4E81_005654 [Alternaria sp. BMP 2799]
MNAKTSLHDISSASANHRQDAIPPTLIEPLKARSQAEEVPIEARGRVNTSTGRGKREAEAEAEVEALEARLRVGSKAGGVPRDADAETVKRAIGFPKGGSSRRRRDAQGLKFNSPGGHRRDADAEAIDRSIGLPEGNLDTDGVTISNEALADRSRLVTWPRTRDAEASNDVVARGKGVPWTPKRDAEAIKINSPGGHRREAEPIKQALGLPAGGSDTDGLATSNAALAERGHNVSWGGKRATDPADDLAERDRGSRLGGRKRGLIRHPGGSPKRDLTPGRGDSYRREAEPIRHAPGGGCPRDAAPVKIPLGGCRRDAAAQPNRIGGGISGGRRNTIPRGIRGNGANPRGVRPGNGNNPRGFVRPGSGTRPRDVIAETVEARGRYRGSSRLV